MKDAALLATALAIFSGSAHAADMPVKAPKAPPPAFEPWDVAFGGGIVSDYVVRGITLSNHKPSVTAYIEPRYNVTKDLQLYFSVSGESVSLPNRAAAEVDVYGGIRPTFGPVALDIGVGGYFYPGGTCFFGAPGIDFAGNFQGAECAANALINGNVVKKDLSFFEVYGKLSYTVNDNWSFSVNEYYTPNFLNSGAWGNYASVAGKYTAPGAMFGSSGVGMYVSGEFGRQWLGTSDSFYGVAAFPNGVKFADYNTWNVGVGFTYNVFTLDLRYSDTNLSRGNCNAFAGGTFAANVGTDVTPINPSGVGSGWCGAAGIAKLSFDLTAINNLK